MFNLTTKALLEILILAVIALAIGEAYIIARGGAPAASTARISDPAGGEVHEDARKPAPSNILVPLGGVVQGVSGSTITLSGESQSIRVTVSSDTTVIRQGNLKDADTRDAEVEAFRVRSAELAEDPAKNRAALQRLVAPSPYVEQVIDVSDINAGDRITAFADGQTESGEYTAVRITVLGSVQ